MHQITLEQLEQVARIVAFQPEAGHDAAATDLLGDELLARRAIDWLAEAFGLVLIQHIAAIELPRTFKALNCHGEWQEIPFNAEPVFGQALRLGRVHTIDPRRSIWQTEGHGDHTRTVRQD
jgi:hypothetical protein